MKNIIRHYWPSWAKKSRKNTPIWQRKKRSIIKTMHACTPVIGKRFESNEDVITETEAYFEELLKYLFLDGLKKLKDR